MGPSGLLGVLANPYEGQKAIKDGRKISNFVFTCSEAWLPTRSSVFLYLKTARIKYFPLMTAPVERVCVLSGTRTACARLQAWVRVLTTSLFVAHPRLKVSCNLPHALSVLIISFPSFAFQL